MPARTRASYRSRRVTNQELDAYRIAQMNALRYEQELFAARLRNRDANTEVARLNVELNHTKTQVDQLRVRVRFLVDQSRTYQERNFEYASFLDNVAQETKKLVEERNDAVDVLDAENRALKSEMEDTVFPTLFSLPFPASPSFFLPPHARRTFKS